MGFNPGVCLGQAVNAKCPVACGQKECYGASARPDRQQVWERIMRVGPTRHGGSPDDKHGHVLCIAQNTNIDAIVDECRRTGGAATAVWSNLKEQMGSLFNATNCDDLKAAVDPFCSFSVGTDDGTTGNRAWVRSFDQKIQISVSFTLTFWVKAVKGEASLQVFPGVGQRFFPTVMFFSSLSPPNALVTFSIDKEEFNISVWK